MSLFLWSDAVSELVVLRDVNVAIYCMLISSSLPLTYLPVKSGITFAFTIRMRAKLHMRTNLVRPNLIALFHSSVSLLLT